MNIYFSCSTRNILKHKKNYQKIRDSIKSLGHTIGRDWLEYSIRVAEKHAPDVKSNSIYYDVMSAILTSDMFIVDVTQRSMSIGHQITFAIYHKKPVLVIQAQQENDPSIEALFISGIKSPLVVMQTYEKTEQILAIVKEFIQKFETNAKTRFNLVLNKAQDSYIEWAAYKYRLSKTEIIQKAIEEKMEGDKSFTDHLNI